MTQPTLSDESEPHSRSHLFTVRVWMQERGDGEKEWHGKVQDVPSGNLRYFRDWATLVAFIQQALADAPLPDRR